VKKSGLTAETAEIASFDPLRMSAHGEPAETPALANNGSRHLHGFWCRPA
jgi:hypothetical protein